MGLEKRLPSVFENRYNAKEAPLSEVTRSSSVRRHQHQHLLAQSILFST